MFLFNKFDGKDISSFAEYHWEQLSKFTLKGKVKIYPSNSFIEKIRALALRKSSSQVFFQDLLDDDFKLLKILICGDTLDLQKYIARFENKVQANLYPRITEIVTKKVKVKSKIKNIKVTVPTEFGKEIIYVFNYDNFNTKKKEWCSYKLCEKLQINVCPYCNRNYTFTIFSNDSGLVRPELDHFLSQEKYPYLALSFYNLIPSCHLCNSNLKHKKEFEFGTHLHPYVYGLDDIVRFTVKFNDIRITNYSDIEKHIGVAFFSGDTKSFKLDFIPKTKDADLINKANLNIEVFRLKELYNEHKDLVQEIIQSAVIYNDEYIDELLNDYTGLFNSRDEVLRFATRNYSNTSQMNNRTFSKLTKDISIEFGIKY